MNFLLQCSQVISTFSFLTRFSKNAFLFRWLYAKKQSREQKFKSFKSLFLLENSLPHFTHLTTDTLDGFKGSPRALPVLNISEHLELQK